MFREALVSTNDRLLRRRGRLGYLWLIGLAMSLVGSILAIGAAPAGAVPDCTVAADCVIVASGDAGVTVTDDHPTNPATLTAQTVTPMFATVYAPIEGAAWISDQWLADGAGGFRQARTFERYNVGAGGATYDNVLASPCPDAGPGDSCGLDYGADWHSRRTYHVPVTIPDGKTVTDVRLELAVDNVATVVINPGEAGAQTLLEANCTDYIACNAKESNFRDVLTVDGDGAGFHDGANTVDVTVDDWGSVTGVIFKITVGVEDDTDGRQCQPSDDNSCSLTARLLESGLYRFCYTPTDGVARTVRLMTDTGTLKEYTLQAGSHVDVALATDATVYYPTASETIALASLRDDRPERCPDS